MKKYQGSRDIEEILNIQYLPGEKYMKSLQCRMCKDMLFQDGGTTITQGEFCGLLKAITLHFRLQHNIQIVNCGPEPSKTFEKYFKNH